MAGGRGYSPKFFMEQQKAMLDIGTSITRGCHTFRLARNSPRCRNSRRPSSHVFVLRNHLFPRASARLPEKLLWFGRLQAKAGYGEQTREKEK
jgi:hypothetical protein